MSANQRNTEIVYLPRALGRRVREAMPARDAQDSARMRAFIVTLIESGLERGVTYDPSPAPVQLVDRLAAWLRSEMGLTKTSARTYTASIGSACREFGTLLIPAEWFMRGDGTADARRRSIWRAYRKFLLAQQELLPAELREGLQQWDDPSAPAGRL